MARFDISCEHCGIMEVVRPITEDGEFVCPVCKRVATRLWSPSAGHKMPEIGSPEQERYIRSDAVQAKLRSGELEIASKSSDLAHRGIDPGGLRR